uniref:Leucine-rich repeat-containing N-terminal plant-type domain-containing protein n=1 Tax=Oryza meridionalis TaxID=40149 RepID=A0A0E0CG02_9ORYZ
MAMAMTMLFRISAFLLLLCSVKATDDSGAETEAEALLRWKSTLINATSLSSWSMANSTCSWFGVTCDTAGHVTNVSLPRARLNGTLDAFYSAAFQNLTTINLQDNSLVGTIPANICMLHTLTYLYLSCNDLTGAIPYQLSKLPRLAHLDLGDNHLTNPEYAMFFTPMPCLEFLSLYDNHLNGIFPEFILNSTRPIPDSLPEIAPNLRHLDFSNNGFHGSIPHSLSRLQKLQALYLHRNNLTGAIPDELGNLTNLEALGLSSNRLVGSLPPSLARMQRLSYFGIGSNYINDSMAFDVSNNMLTGSTPSLISNWTNLRYLVLFNNKFTGAIVGEIGNLAHLHEVDMSKNGFTGKIPLSICNASLQYLAISDNHLEGELPECLWNLTNLIFMDLSSNGFSGQVPTSSNYESSLKSLHLSNNNLSGRFPTVLKNLKNLVVLDLGHNKISGVIPSWVGESNPLLRILRLRSNLFHGSIPCQLSKLSQLQLLDLAENNFIGSGTEYTFQGSHDCVIGIDLSSNFLSGEIPSELTNLRGLQLLNMSRNVLYGGIPNDIGNLTSHIPPSISKLTFLNWLNLSNNLLSGEIPTGNQLRTLDDPSIYANNPGLCGFPLKIPCSNHSSSTSRLERAKEHHQELETLWLYCSVTAGAVFGVWLCFGALFFCNAWRLAFFSRIDAMQQKLMQNITHLKHLRRARHDAGDVGPRRRVGDERGVGPEQAAVPEHRAVVAEVEPTNTTACRRGARGGEIRWSSSGRRFWLKEWLRRRRASSSIPASLPELRERKNSLGTSSGSARMVAGSAAMALHSLFHVSIILLLCTARCKAADSESAALLKWKSTLIAASSLTSWSVANSTCSWFGVTCDHGGHVTELNLESAGLKAMNYCSTLLSNNTEHNKNPRGKISTIILRNSDDRSEEIVWLPGSISTTPSPAVLHLPLALPPAPAPPYRRSAKDEQWAMPMTRCK